MNIKQSYVAATICLLLVSVMPSSQVSESADRIYVVSMVNLIGSPEDYVGMNLQTVGFFKRHGNMRLFLTKEHALISDVVSSILISDTDNGDIYASGCLRSYSEITGNFTLIDPGAYGIVSVERIYDPIEKMVCWERRD